MFRIEGMGMVFGKLMYIHIYIFFRFDNEGNMAVHSERTS